MNKFIKIIASIFIVAVAVIGVYFFRQWIKQNAPVSGIMVRQNGTGRTLSDAPKTFTHPDYGFSFDYPADFTVGNFSENESKTVIVQGKDGEDSFQIIVSPYEEDAPLSFESIRNAAEGLKVAGEKEIQIGQDKIKAFSFTLEATDEVSTEPEDPLDASDEIVTNEIWFGQGGNLYQITDYSDSTNAVPKILDSLRFK